MRFPEPWGKDAELTTTAVTHFAPDPNPFGIGVVAKRSLAHAAVEVVAFSDNRFVDHRWTYAEEPVFAPAVRPPFVSEPWPVPVSVQFGQFA